MNEFTTYEYVVPRARVGKYRLARAGLICAYILYAILFFLAFAAGRLLVPLIALLPLSTWMLVFFTWRYVNVEYEYSITSGVLTFTKIYGNRTRRTLTEIKIKSAATIAPLNQKLQRSRLEAYGAVRIYSALSSPDAPDAYFMIYENDEGERCAFLFEATAQALNICKFYNMPATLAGKVKY